MTVRSEHGHLVCSEIACASNRFSCSHVFNAIRLEEDVPLTMNLINVPIKKDPYVGVDVSLEPGDGPVMAKLNVQNWSHFDIDLDTRLGFIDPDTQGRLALRELVIPTLWQLAYRDLPSCGSDYHSLGQDPVRETNGITGRYLRWMLHLYIMGECERCSEIAKNLVPADD